MGRPRKPFDAYLGEIARLLTRFRVGEAAAADVLAPPVGARTDERLAQCIWLDSLFLHDGLRTDSGQPLKIVQTGRWNLDEGPDFLGAHLTIGGRDVRGDVEVHLEAEGWRQHRHHLNPQYDGVALHAYLWQTENPRPARNSQGMAIEGFAMEPHLFPDLETIRQTIRVEDYPYRAASAIGRCQPVFCSLDPAYVGELLDAAGRERLEGKASRLADQSVGVATAQLFYQALMIALGHKANKSLFFLLSKRAPIGELLDYLRDVGAAGAGDGVRARQFFQAALLSVAQLAPADCDAHVPPAPCGARVPPASCGAGVPPASDLATAPATDAETGAYLTGLRALWRPVAGYFSDRTIPPTRQWTAGVRPVNFAQRRIAGLAHLLGRWFLAGEPAEALSRRIREFPSGEPLKTRRRWIQRELISAFEVDDAEDFWAWHYNFTSRRTVRPMKLIGKDRAASIAFNALLPLVLFWARRTGDTPLEERVWDVFEAFPPLESNAIVRYMRMRLFGESPVAGALLDSEARQQALFQIFASCCYHNETSCEDCRFNTLSSAEEVATILPDLPEEEPAE
jgi:hypothetical protein